MTVSPAVALLWNARALQSRITRRLRSTNTLFVQRAFEELSKDKTVIMIAHRLTTVRNADRIFVLKDGKIQESGTHDKLAEADGLYSKMWQDYQTSVNWKVGGAI